MTRTRPSTLRLECLEDRSVPATFNVTTTLDVIDPADGKRSLREAITEANTLAVTASDVTTGESVYVLCAAETVDTSPDATASLRGLTASWTPTA